MRDSPGDKEKWHSETVKLENICVRCTAHEPNCTVSLFQLFLMLRAPMATIASVIYKTVSFTAQRILDR